MKRHPIVDTYVIDSKDRITSSAGSTDFSVTLLEATQKVSELHFRKFLIPLNMDNVTTSNCSYEIDDVAGTTIALGQYTITTLMSKLTADIAGYTFTYGNDGRVTITNDLAATFKWEPLTCGELLGFSSILYNTPASSYTGEVLPILLPTKYITVHSKIIYDTQKNSLHHTDGRSDLIAFIPVVADLGSLLVHIPDEPLIIWVDYRTVTTLDMVFKDDQKRVLNLQGASIVVMVERHP